MKDFLPLEQSDKLALLVRAWRQVNSLTQEEVAAELGIGGKFRLSRIENLRYPISVDLAFRIMKVTGADIKSMTLRVNGYQIRIEKIPDQR